MMGLARKLRQRRSGPRGPRLDISVALVAGLASASLPLTPAPGLAQSESPPSTRAPKATDPAAAAPQAPAAAQGGVADGGVPSPAQPSTDPSTELPAENRPRLSVELSSDALHVGEIVHVTITADALATDDVTIPDQTFEPFEVRRKRQRVTPDQDGRHNFVFELALQSFESGDLELPAVTLRVVTHENLIGSVQTPPQPISVKSALANEPNAKLKPETKPVVVMQDDYTLLYVLLGVLAALAIVGLTVLIQRYLRRRPKPEPPPPPPRPPWEIAHEKLLALRRRKQRMLEAGQGVQFVDEVSDAVRECLGGCFGFDGLDTTTEEMLIELRTRHAASGLQEETRAYLNRCDLVKFAKVEPDQDELDLILAKAQDIVQFSVPTRPSQAPNQGGSPAGRTYQDETTAAPTPDGPSNVDGGAT